MNETMRLFEESVEEHFLLFTFRDGCHGYSGKQMVEADWLSGGLG